MYENHFCNVRFFYAQLCSVLFGFQFGLFAYSSTEQKRERVRVRDRGRDVCVCGGMRDFQCTRYIWYNISFANCDCCVSFTLLPSGVRCVVDFSLFSLYVYINFLLLHFCLFYISTEHTTRVKL